MNKIHHKYRHGYYYARNRINTDRLHNQNFSKEYYSSVMKKDYDENFSKGAQKAIEELF